MSTMKMLMKLLPSTFSPTEAKTSVKHLKITSPQNVQIKYKKIHTKRGARNYGQAPIMNQ